MHFKRSPQNVISFDTCRHEGHLSIYMCWYAFQMLFSYFWGNTEKEPFNRHNSRETPAMMSPLEVAILF